MFPRKVPFFRQNFASPLGQGETGFAATRAMGHGEAVARGSDPAAPACLDCYPFPSPWPGPLRVGPFFCPRHRADRVLRRQVADASIARIFGFAFALDSLESNSITITNRGSLPCGKPSSSSPLPPCRLPAACRTPRRAVWLARLQAPSLPMQPTTTPLPVPSSAALRALHPARCLPRNAVSRATPATDLTAASAASEPFQQGPIGQAARLALFHFAHRPQPGRHEGRAPCSRKS